MIVEKALLTFLHSAYSGWGSSPLSKQRIVVAEKEDEQEGSLGNGLVIFGAPTKRIEFNEQIRERL